MRKALGVFGGVPLSGRRAARGMTRTVGLATKFHPTYLLSLLVLLMPHAARAQEPAWWTKQKADCGVSSGTAYNDWVAQGSPCKKSSAGSGSNVPSVPAGLTPQQQLAMQGAALGGYMIGKGLHDILFGNPTVTPPVDPAQEQAQLAAQQLNRSGLWFLRQKKYPQAIHEFEQALQKTPGDGGIQDNLALAKRQMEQSRKDGAAANQTSSALGNLLGGSSAVPASPVAGIPGSELNSIDLNSSVSVADLHGAMSPSADSEALKSQIDGVLGTAPPAPAAPAHTPQAQDIEKLFQAAISEPAKQPEIQNPKMVAERTAKEIDQALGQSQSADAQQPRAEAVAGNGSGSADTNAVTQQPDAHVLNGVANPDFDGRGTGNAALKKFDLPSAQPGASGVDLRGASRTAVDPARVKGPTATDAVAGTPAATPLAMRPAGMATFSAAGAPIFDCQGDRTLIMRLKSGLPAQDEAILRTSEALEGAKTDSEEARKKALMAGFKTLNSAAITASELSKAALAKVEGLQAHGITVDAATRFRLLQQIRGLAVEAQELAEGTEGPEKIVKAYKGGKAIGELLRVQKASQGVLDKLMAIEKELRASGVQDDVLEAGGAHLAMYVFGPIGGPIGAALVHTIANGSEFVKQAGEDWNSTGEAEAAERNLSVMRDQERLVRERIYELRQEIVEGCSNAPAENK